MNTYGLMLGLILVGTGFVSALVNALLTPHWFTILCAVLTGVMLGAAATAVALSVLRRR